MKVYLLNQDYFYTTPLPSFYLQASKFTLEIAHGSPCHLRSLRTLDPYIKFTLGFSTHRSSVLSAVGPVGPLMTWPPGEVVTLAGWHTAPYFTFKIELFHDRSPCSDDTFGSKSIDLSCHAAESAVDTASATPQPLGCDEAFVYSRQTPGKGAGE